MLAPIGAEIVPEVARSVPKLPTSVNRTSKSKHLRMRISAGVHEVNLRVDGGPWIVPAGLVRMDDGLGGSVGVFVVE